MKKPSLAKNPIVFARLLSLFRDGKKRSMPVICLEEQTNKPKLQNPLKPKTIHAAIANLVERGDLRKVREDGFIYYARTKPANYRTAIEWIALNDGAGETFALDKFSIADYLTVVLVADIFDVPAIDVAQDVVEFRREELKRERKAK
jgi:hypothetical protein